MASGRLLENASIMVLEDDYYLATDLEHALRAAGATIIGPFGDAADASRALADRLPYCAFVDVNLGDGPSFEIPRRLLGSAVPFIFVTGYDAGTIPDEFAASPRLEKPVEAGGIVLAASRMLGGALPGG